MIKTISITEKNMNKLKRIEEERKRRIKEKGENVTFSFLILELAMKGLEDEES